MHITEEQYASCQKAIAHFTEAIRLSPMMHFVYKHRADVYYQLGELDAAYADYEIAKRSQNPHRALVGMAKIDFCRDDHDLAIKHIDSALHAFRSYRRIYMESEYLKEVGEAHYVRGKVNLATGDYHDAIHDFNKVLQLPNSGDHDHLRASAHVMKGRTYSQMQEWDVAILNYNAAIDISPALDEAYQLRDDAKRQKKQTE